MNLRRPVPGRDVACGGGRQDAPTGRTAGLSSVRSPCNLLAHRPLRQPLVPDYYRLLDQARALTERARNLLGPSRSVFAPWGEIRARLDRLGRQTLALPTQARQVSAAFPRFPDRVRASLTAATFPYRQTCLGLAALGAVVLAQRVAPGNHASAAGDGPGVAPAVSGPRTRVPTEVQGRWVMATSGATNYWSHDTGVFQGSGHGLSQIYEFYADGSYRTFVYMEIRSNYSWVKMNNSCQGTVEFKGDHLTLHAARGHFDATGTSYVNRDMTTDDLAKWSTTYRWQRENGADGQPRLLLDNENAAKPERTEYKVLTD